jgi:N6-L-threonylcarbamoyladenine synthase
MRILAIETSCDETAISILDCSGDTSQASFNVLGNALYSQAHLHAEYGGVFPTLAKREHIKNLPVLLHEALASACGKVLGYAALQPDQSDADAAASLNIELIAVTHGPGLEPALWTGLTFAEDLGKKWGVPVVGADHMEGHIMSGLVEGDGTKFTLKAPSFPILALLISGGHTELVAMKQWFEYDLVGRTKDDAIGEAFDKVARMLGLPYPGGPEVDKHAARARARNAQHDVVFPRPLAHENSCDFSFSGLKTAVLYKLREMGQISDEDKEHIAQAFEDAARDVIILKTRRALEQTGARTLAVGGGVSANAEIRTGLAKLVSDEFPDTILALPHKALTGDNAIMIGMAAYMRHTVGAEPFHLKAEGAKRLAVIGSK